MLKLEKLRGGGAIPIQSERCLQLFAEGLRIVNTNISLDSAIKRSISIAKKITKADEGDVLLIDEQADSLSASFLQSEKAEQKRSCNISRTISNWVLENRQVYCTGHTEGAAMQFLMGDEQLYCQNILCLPLINGKDQPVGVLQVGNKDKYRRFTEEDIVFLDLFSRHISAVISSLRKAARLQARAEENEMLMTEIHHRLKNNLSSITSLIELELDQVGDKHASDVLRQTCARIKSITEVHNTLYQLGPTKPIDLASHFRKLTDEISKILGIKSENIHIIEDGASVAVSSEQTMTCGLLLEELITNAYKHAFVSVEEGEVRIEISENPEGTIGIIVSDNGRGIDNKFAVNSEGSMGCWIMKALANRINATVDVSSDEGTRYSLTFKK